MIALFYILACSSTEEVTPAPPPSQPNFVVIDIDSLRWDRMVANTPIGKPYAKNIQHLAHQSIFLNSVYAPASWTYPALTGLLTGQYPPISDYQGNQMAWISDTQRSLPEILRLFGYKTAVFWGQTLPAKQASFSKVFDKQCLTCTDPDLQAPIEWLKDTPDTPFFLFIHNIDLHHYHPFIPSSSLHQETPAVDNCEQADITNVYDFVQRTLPKEQAQQHTISHYNGMLNYYDSWLESLFLEIASRADAENTVIVVLSNHGEALFESENLGHARLHHETVLRTGLVWHDPQMTITGENSTPLSLLDVAPTILERARIPKDQLMNGRSFLSLLQGKQWSTQPVFSITDLHAASIIEDEYKLSIQYTNCMGQPRTLQPLLGHDVCTILIDRKNDPYEEQEAHQEITSLKSRLEKTLLRWIETRIMVNETAPKSEANEKLKQTLKERGYWGDQPSKEDKTMQEE